MPIPRRYIKKIKRILILYWGFFGDVLLTTPFIEILRKGFPGAHITYIVGRGFRSYESADELLMYNPNIDNVIKAGVSLPGKVIRDEPYDLAIDLCGNKTCSLIVKLSGARMKISGRFRGLPSRFRYSECFEGEWSPLLKKRLKKITYWTYRVQPFLELASFLGIDTKRFAEPKIYLSRREENFSKSFLKKIHRKNRVVIAIQPGGRVHLRLWSTRNYAALADGLMEKYNAKILVFYYVPFEKYFADRVCEQADNGLSRMSERDIRRYLAKIAACDLFIGTDGGALQMALALGVPAVGIFKNRENAIYWYNYERRKGLFSVFVRPDGNPERKVVPAGMKRRDAKDVRLVLGAAEEALRLKRA